MNYAGITLADGSKYSDWNAGLGENYVNIADDTAGAAQMWDQGKLPFIHVMFHPTRQPGCTIEKIAAGDYDHLIENWLMKLLEYTATGRKAVVLYLPEMNGDWTVYGPEGHPTWGASPASFIKAYRDFVARGRAMGLDETKVLWAWGPNNVGWGSLKDWWPGSDVVNVIGGSCYNWGGLYPGYDWVSPTKLFDGYVDELRGFEMNLPIFITQMASGLNDSRTPAWLDEAVAYANGPKIEGFHWFSIGEFTYGPGPEDWNVRTATLDDTRPDDWFIEETEMDPTRNMYYPKQGDSGFAVEYWQVRIIEAAKGVKFYGNSNKAFVEAESDLTFKIWDQKTTDLLSSWTHRNSYGVGPTEAIMIEDATLGE